MKKSISIMLAMAVIVASFPFMVSASSLEVAGKDVRNYKMETGQIDLRDIQEDMYVENGEVKIQNIQTAEAYELQKELSNSDNLNDLIAHMMSEGMVPEGIGYTIVDLKEVIDENGNSHLEPMTIRDMQARGNGTTVSKGNLRLYIAASKISAGKYKTVTTAQWTTDFQFSAENRPADGYDYISVTAPKDFEYSRLYFTSTTSGLKNQITDYERVDMSYSSVVYKFKEFINGVYSTKECAAWMNCDGEVSSKNSLFIGKYLHTWASVTPAITIGPASVAFSPVSKSWQIVCDYKYPV